MPINTTANTVCKFSPCSQSNMDYAVWTIFVLGTKITILCLSSSQSITCISPCISHLYMTVYLMIVSIRTWWSTVNIFKCVYINIWTVLGEQRTACWSLLHISSLFTVLHLCSRSQHAVLIILTQLVPFWTLRETTTWYWGPQAASHPPQVVPFPRDTLSAVNSVELHRSHWADQKEDSVTRGIIHTGLISPSRCLQNWLQA